jgi:hypothetical protein
MTTRQQAEAYTVADWQADVLAIFGRRATPPSCIRCGRSGFFGPRRGPDDRRYRLCKFCGFYEAIGDAAIACRATIHGCAQWPRVAGAPYVWWVPPDERQYRCPYCGAAVEVGTATVARPVDDPSHPWRDVPQGATFDQAAAFWARHGRAGVYL